MKFYHSSKSSNDVSTTSKVKNGITGTKVNKNVTRATLCKEIPSLIPTKELLYAHTLVKKLFLSNQLPTVQIAGRVKHFTSFGRF